MSISVCMPHLAAHLFSRLLRKQFKLPDGLATPALASAVHRMPSDLMVSPRQGETVPPDRSWHEHRAHGRRLGCTKRQAFGYIAADRAPRPYVRSTPRVIRFRKTNAPDERS